MKSYNAKLFRIHVGGFQGNFHMQLKQVTTRAKLWVTFFEKYEILKKHMCLYLKQGIKV